MAAGMIARAALLGGGLLLAAVGPLPAGETPHARIRAGNRAYETEDYVEAEVGYRKALEAAPDLPEGRFNLGDALYRQGRYEPAAGAFEEAAGSAGTMLRANAEFNRGNALFREKKYRESIDAYVEALRADPDDEDAKYNLSLARRMLKTQPQDRQEGPSGPQEGEPREQEPQEQKPQEDASGTQGAEKGDAGEKRSDAGEEREDPRVAPPDGEEPDAGNARAEPGPESEPAPGAEPGVEDGRAISRAEAERILQAVRNNEKDVQKKLRARASGPVDVERDW